MTFYMMVWNWLRLAEISLDHEWDLIQLDLERQLTTKQIIYVYELRDL